MTLQKQPSHLTLVPPVEVPLGPAPASSLPERVVSICDWAEESGYDRLAEDMRFRARAEEMRQLRESLFPDASSR